MRIATRSFGQGHVTIRYDIGRYVIIDPGLPVVQPRSICNIELNGRYYAGNQIPALSFHHLNKEIISFKSAVNSRTPTKTIQTLHLKEVPELNSNQLIP